MSPTPLTPQYALVEALKNVLDVPSEDGANDVDLQRAIDAASSWIDWFTGRTFGLSAAGVVRIYPATTFDAVDVVDLQSTAPTVAQDTGNDRTFATTLTPAQVELWPTAGPPFQEVRAWQTPPAGTDPAVFEPGQLVRITGQWGYADSRGRLPAAVNQACLLLAARWFKRREAPFSVLQSTQLDVFQRVPEQDPDVSALLFPLCREGSPGARMLAATVPGAGLPPGAAWVLV